MGIAAFALLLAGNLGLAEASSPGRNGSLAISVDTCGDYAPSIRLVGIRGEPISRVTPACQPSIDGESDRSAELLDWSPDGRWLLIQQTGAEPSGLVTLAPDGTGPKSVALVNDAFPPSDASFAPDGRNIAYLRKGSVWRGATDGTDKRKLLALPRCNLDLRDCSEFWEVEWSPNGRYIAVAVQQTGSGPGRPPRIRPGIWLISSRTGKRLRRVTKSGVDVDWSPDSRRLVYRTDYYQQERGGATGGDIWTVGADGRGARRIVRRPRVAETAPTWSPDGRWIAWISLRFGPGDVGFSIRPSLWRTRADGSSPQRVMNLPGAYAEEGEFYEPRLAWQPLPDTPGLGP